MAFTLTCTFHPTLTRKQLQVLLSKPQKNCLSWFHASYSNSAIIGNSSFKELWGFFPSNLFSPPICSHRLGVSLVLITSVSARSCLPQPTELLCGMTDCKRIGEVLCISKYINKMNEFAILQTSVITEWLSSSHYMPRNSNCSIYEESKKDLLCTRDMQLLNCQHLIHIPMSRAFSWSSKADNYLQFPFTSELVFYTNSCEVV